MAEDYRTERKRVDDYIASRLAERRKVKAVSPPPQVPGPNSNGLMNLMNILLGRSPLQKEQFGVKR